MKLEKIKDILKDKRNITIAGAVTGVAVIVIAGSLLLHNKVNEKNKVEDNKVVTVNKDNTEEKEVKKQLEDLNKIDISKLSEEDKKSMEDTKKIIEDMISNKEYAKAKKEIDSLRASIDNKIKEMAEKEKSKEEVKEEKKEENTVENVEESKEVVPNTTDSTSNNTSSNNLVSENSSSNGSSSQEVVQQPTIEPEQSAPQSQPEPTPEPAPQPPVEEVKPVYPSVEEVKQRLISYGQSLGYTYNSALEGSGFNAGGTSQMWGSGLGGNADGQTLFNGLDSLMVDKEFGVTVVDLGNGYVEMSVWIR